MGGRAKLAALAAVVAVGVGGGTYVATSCGCNVTGANIWVSTAGTGASAVRHSTLVSDPGGNGDFLTLDAAYQASHRGDIIAVNCGTYAPETVALRSSPAEAAPATVFAPVSPVSGCVTVSGTLTVAASWVAFTRGTTPTCFSVTGGHVKDYGSACSSPGTANIWVSTTGNDGSCTRSASLISDPASGADCATFNKATSIASAGDSVRIACGTYSAVQHIVNAPGVAPAVVLDSATGAAGCVTHNNLLSIDASYVTLQDFHSCCIRVGQDGCLAGPVTPDHVTLNRIDTEQFTFQGATNFLFEYSTIGPLTNDQNIILGCVITGGADASGTFDHNTVKDLLQSDVSVHASALYLNGDVDGVTVSNNKFLNYTQTGLRLDGDLQCNPAIYSCRSPHNEHNVTVTNNVFDTPCSHAADFPVDDSACGPIAAIRVEQCSNGAIQNLVIRNNTLDGAFQTGSTASGGGCSPTGEVFANNLVNADSGAAVAGDCSNGYLGAFTFTYDVWTSGYGCGTGSTGSGTVTFTNAAAYDFTITTGTGCDFVSTSQPYPATDIVGTTRPDGGESFVDAGAYETCP